MFKSPSYDIGCFGCLLGYTLIADEMKDAELRGLIERIGYDEGLKVVVDPGVIDPKAFITELLDKRLPNSNVPDTPQRIATDTSQKLAFDLVRRLKLTAIKRIPCSISPWLLPVGAAIC